MRIGSAPVNWLVAVALLGACAAGGLALYHYAGPEEVETPGPTSGGVADSRIEGQVHQFCGACHAYPSPDTFPKRYWRKEVEQGFRFFSRSGMDLSPPKVEAVVRYYEDRAPDELPAAPSPPAPGAPKLRFEKMPGRGAPNSDTNAIANVNLVRLPRPGEALSDETPLDVLACDMLNGRVMRLRPSDPASGWEVLARLSNPARTEVTDLDGDGILDILVADLGSFPPTNDYCGKVVWLRGAKDGTYEPITLLEKVGRVSDVRVADFRGAGRKDVLVGSFGWINSGELILLENHTEDWASPDFRPKVLDERHGVIHAPVADLNGDGRPDFVTVWAQEFESVEAFINKGDGEFERTVLYEGPHPGYGSSGIELADVDADGELDVLYTNGDILDAPYLFKPYHGVQWLKNLGGLEFEHSPLTPLYGAHNAASGDLNGDGRPDVVAVSFLPADKFPERAERRAESLLVLTRNESGGFARHPLTVGECDHVSVAVGDVTGDGRPDVVVGNFDLKEGEPVTIWENLTPPVNGRVRKEAGR